MVTFQSGASAKEYFVAQILQEASRQSVQLADLERDMLFFTEDAPDAKPEYLEQSAQFDSQYNMENFEEKICSLLKGVWEHADTEVRENLRSAYDVLRKEDHYILVMISEALGWKLRRKWLGLF